MENKTDKPYSLQDAKESISKINGFNDWSYLRSKYSKDGIETTMAEAAELYASKATEELRKEVESLKQSLQASERFRMQDAVTHIKEQNDVRSYLNPTLKRVSEDDLKKALHEVSEKNKAIRDSYTDGSNQSELLSEIERLKESNKELVEALNDNKAAADQAMRALERYGKGSQKKQEDLDLTEIAECLYSISNPNSEAFVKSEGDVNKKI